MSQRKYRIHIVGPEAYEEMVEAARSLDESLPSHGVALVEDATERTGFVFPMYPDDTKEEEIKAWEPIVQAALSAAEKERNGSKLPATQEGREGECCCIAFPETASPDCSAPGHHDVFIAYRDRRLVEQRLEREGDVIEKLRGWAKEHHKHERTRESRSTRDSDYLGGKVQAFGEVLRFLDSLSSEEGR